jgi:hypothetical protein
MELGNKQFLFTKHKKHSNNITILSEEIADYILYYHKNLHFNKAETKDKSIYLLGDLFDYEVNSASNKTLLNQLAETVSLKTFFERLDQFYGEYIIIYKTKNHLIILNDCCAQHEVYYNSDYTEFGSQICLFEDLIAHKNHSYYDSKLFQQKKLYIGNTTPYSNINHLIANHYLDVLNFKTIRFYPNKTLEALDLEMVAKKASQQLKGYVTAISKQYKIVLPVTGGFDSRLLFLASLDLDCEYFVSKHANMDNNHYDITIAQQLCDLYGKTLHIIEDTSENNIALESNNTLDFPRNGSFPKKTKNKAVVNGNISEIARNYFNYHKKLTGEKLSLLNGFSQNDFAINQYQNWLDTNQPILKAFNFNTLDLFYWEEKMSNWTAKAKTEANTINVSLFSPFNSRSLLELLLSTNKKHRDKFTSKLYKAIICNLTDKYEVVNNIPTNPNLERKRALILKKLRLFKCFDAARLQLRIWKRLFS